MEFKDGDIIVWNYGCGIYKESTSEYIETYIQFILGEINFDDNPMSNGARLKKETDNIWLADEEERNTFNNLMIWYNLEFSNGKIKRCKLDKYCWIDDNNVIQSGNKNDPETEERFNSGNFFSCMSAAAHYVDELEEARKQIFHKNKYSNYLL